MNTEISDKEILRLWRDINFSGSYKGVKTFQLLLKTDLNLDIPERRLYNVLKNDPVFLIHLKPKRNFERRSFDLNYYGEVLQSDLGFMFENKGFKYFLLIIDCYSHKIFVKAIKDKKSSTILDAFKEGLQFYNTDITKVETDQGTEYSLVKQYCKQNNIIFKYKFGKNKARYFQAHLITFYML